MCNVNILLDFYAFFLDFLYKFLKYLKYLKDHYWYGPYYRIWLFT